MEASFHLKNEMVVAKVNKASFIPYLHVLAVEAAVEGTLLVTQAQTYFRVAETGGILVSLPHGCVERVRKVQGKEKTGTAYVVDIFCKDLRTLRIGLPSKLQYKQFVSVLESLAYELEISQLFALKWQETAFGTWRFDAVAEYERCGLHTGDFRLTSFNKSYSACDSYPQVLAVPALAKDELLLAVAQFRSRGRLPVATYRCAQTGAALYRCSQPLVGLKNTRCADDEVLLSMMAALPARNTSVKLHIMDARPKVKKKKRKEKPEI
jgi:myotubularin-related protein 1/2